MFESLLATVIAHPDDDAPRLVMADWLDENGDGARAEFIRVQCELERLRQECGDGNYAAFGREVVERKDALRWRERELLESMQLGSSPAWTGLTSYAMYVWSEPIAGLLKSNAQNWRFVRGFVSAITCAWPDLETHASAIIAATPLRDAHLTTWPPQSVWKWTAATGYEPFRDPRWPGVLIHLPPRAEWRAEDEARGSERPTQPAGG